MNLFRNKSHWVNASRNVPRSSQEAEVYIKTDCCDLLNDQYFRNRFYAILGFPSRESAQCKKTPPIKSSTEINPRIRSKNHPEAPDQRQTTRNATSCRNIYCSPNPNPLGKRKPQKSIQNHNLETQRWQQSRPGESYSVATEDWERITQILSRFHIPKGPITLYRLTKLDRCSQCEWNASNDTTEKNPKGR